MSYFTEPTEEINKPLTLTDVIVSIVAIIFFLSMVYLTLVYA